MAGMRAHVMRRLSLFGLLCGCLSLSVLAVIWTALFSLFLLPGEGLDMEAVPLGEMPWQYWFLAVLALAAPAASIVTLRVLRQAIKREDPLLTNRPVGLHALEFCIVVCYWLLSWVARMLPGSLRLEPTAGLFCLPVVYMITSITFLVMYIGASLGRASYRAESEQRES